MRFAGLNWRRGLFRLWIVGVTLFVIAAASISSSGINKQFHVVLQEHTLGGELVVPQLCFNARGVAGIDYGLHHQYFRGRGSPRSLIK
jgi:hypothetical protein